MLAGYVCLIGAGPGNPGLITSKGIAYIRQADVIVYDHLAPHSLLLEAPKNCQLIYVGKEGWKNHIDQGEINRILVMAAKSGKLVVRLKGGDPFLMGRGGEEAQVLAEAGVSYIIVPGVSSSYAVPAYAGIPVTERSISSGVTVMPGYTTTKDKGNQITQVILMGLANLEKIVSKLMKQGYQGNTPVSVISRGSTAFQKVVTGDLDSIVTLAKTPGIRPPALIVAGEVVQLQNTLAWITNLPLFPKRVLSTRPASKNESKDLELLELYGAEVVRFPAIEIKRLSLKKIIAMLPELQGNSWLVFTSATAVEVFYEALLATEKDWRYFDRSRFAVIGAKTAQALKTHGRIPDVTANEANSEGMLNALRKNILPNETVALCRAKQASPILADGLRASGISYREYVLYEVVSPVYDRIMVKNILTEPFDVIIFTSPLTVSNFWQIVKDSGSTIDGNTKFACLGKETAAELKKTGCSTWVTPEETSFGGLIQMILKQWGIDENVSQYPVTAVTSK